MQKNRRLRFFGSVSFFIKPRRARARRARTVRPQPPAKRQCLFAALHCAGDFARTEAMGAHVDVLGRTVDDRLGRRERERERERERTIRGVIYIDSDLATGKGGR